MKKVIFLLISISFLYSCAGSYKSITPENVTYNSIYENEETTLEYKYSVLNEKGNHKYYKKEYKKGLKLITIKIKNKNESPIMLGKDIILTNKHGEPLPIIPNEIAFKKLKQTSATYLFYLLLTPLNLYTTNESGRQTSSIPIGYGLGPGLTGTNMIIAGSANNKFKDELMRYDLNGINIAPGQTAFGLVCIESDDFPSIRINSKLK